MDKELKAGDIFLTRGDGFVSKAIRFFTRSIGEKRTQVNHAGLVVEDGTLQNCVIVESTTSVLHHKLWDRFGPPDKTSVAIFRPLNITQSEIDIIVAEALEQVGKKYGIFKMAAHLLDWVLLGAYVFRRITQHGSYPICSWLVAHAYAKAGKDFGVDPGAAQPDDIWDFIVNNPDKYEEQHPVKPLWQEEEEATSNIVGT